MHYLPDEVLQDRYAAGTAGVTVFKPRPYQKLYGITLELHSICLNVVFEISLHNCFDTGSYNFEETNPSLGIIEI